METTKKIQYIREEMQAKKIAACIIPSADPHLSEYPAAHWKLREYLSGFTGSNGTLVITAECACLWTDSRYYLQAEKELDTELFTIQREGEAGTPSIGEWLKTNLHVGDSIGVDGSLFAASTLLDWNEEFKRNGIHLQTNFQTSLIQNLPPLPSKKAFLLNTSYSGESTASKINRICNATQCDYTLLTALDDVAWAFNIRGNDIDYNPMVIAYACIGKEKSTLFIADSKLDKSTREGLNNNNISILPYEEIGNFILFLNKNQYTISIDREKTNYALYSLINEQFRRDEKSIVALSYCKPPLQCLCVFSVIKMGGKSSLPTGNLQIIHGFGLCGEAVDQQIHTGAVRHEAQLLSLTFQIAVVDLIHGLVGHLAGGSFQCVPVLVIVLPVLVQFRGKELPHDLVYQLGGHGLQRVDQIDQPHEITGILIHHIITGHTGQHSEEVALLFRGDQPLVGHLMGDGQGVLFRVRDEKRPGAQIVRPHLLGQQGLLHGLGRDADNLIGSQKGADVLRLHVALAHVDAVGVREASDLHTVVDDQRHAIALAERAGVARTSWRLSVR